MRWMILSLALFAGFVLVLSQVQIGTEIDSDIDSENKMARAIKTMEQSGPHGSYDPHVNLGVDKLIDIAVQHWNEGRSNEAYQQLHQAQQLYPQHYKVYAVRASFHLQDNSISAALAELNQALKYKADDVDSLVNRAQTLLRFNRIEEALHDLDAALMIDADSLAANFNRGTLFYKEQKFEQALTDFDRSIALVPHAPAPYFNRAMTLEALGKRDEAIADLKRFLELTDNASWRQSAEQQIKVWQAGDPAEPSIEERGKS